MVMRLMLIVRRRVCRREGLWSIQRPRAPENKRMQDVSAMPLQYMSRRSLRYGSIQDTHFMDEACKIFEKCGLNEENLSI